MTEGKKPVFKARAGTFSVAVFENSGTKKVDGKDETFTYLSGQLQRSYTEDNGNTWKNQNISLRPSDISKLETVVTELKRYFFLKKENVE